MVMASCVAVLFGDKIRSQSKPFLYLFQLVAANLVDALFLVISAIGEWCRGAGMTSKPMAIQRSIFSVSIAPCQRHPAASHCCPHSALHCHRYLLEALLSGSMNSALIRANPSLPLMARCYVAPFGEMPGMQRIQLVTAYDTENGLVREGAISTSTTKLKN